MPGASLALFADLGACHVQKSSVTICVLPALPVKRYRRSISIHALRVKGDLNISDLQMSYITFLSTPSGWRATRLYAVQRLAVENFYPRPPGGGRRQQSAYPVLRSNFYPRPPGGGRPPFRSNVKPPYAGDFYPRPPGGGRPEKQVQQQFAQGFLSTPSGWRATKSCYLHQTQNPHISLHALRVEGD